MQKLKLTLLALALCGGLTTANATLTLVGLFDIQPDNPTDTLAFFQSQTGMLDATNCIDRIDGNQQNGSVVTSGGFTFTFGTSADGQIVTVDFDLTGTGQVLCGFYVKGGSEGGNLYTVAADQGITGSFVLNAPVTGGSGQFAGISHIDVFCCPGGTSVPDGGTTVMLLGSALTGLGLVRRYIKS